MAATSRLFLLPSLIGDNLPSAVLPADYLNVVKDLDIFFVEEIRTARRFLRKVGYTKDFDSVQFIILNEHTKSDINTLVKELDWQGKDMGLLSEAGVPCVADPGAAVVAWAHIKKIRVCPIVGPSSLLLALMASGFNGQCFAFQGYLPVEKSDRQKRLKDLEKLSLRENQSQIFIETPYRNNQMLASICECCADQTMLCIAKNISQEDEYIASKSVKEWRKESIDLHKQNTVFILYAS